MRGSSGDAQGVFEGDRVLDKAGGEGLLQSPELPLIESGNDDPDLKIFEAQRALAGLCLHPNQQALRGEGAQSEVLGDVLADAAAQRGEQELGWRHAMVGGSVFGRLIQLKTVLASLRRKAGTAGVLQSDLQKALPGAITRGRCTLGAI